MKRCRSSEEQANHTNKPRINNGRVLDLPGSIINDILSRLPIKTIFNCMSVCKTFNKILKDPYFAQVHLTKASTSNRCLVIQNINKAPDNYIFVDMIDLEKPTSPLVFDIPWSASILQELHRAHVSTSILGGSCNGLICLTYELPRHSLRVTCILNPLLGEYMVLPPPWDIETYNLPFLGFCPKTKKYKVIQFTSSLYTEIHTLGTSSWRKIDHVPHPSTCQFLDCSFLNGDLPFVNQDSHEVSSKICSFNFEAEQYSYIPPPAHFFIEETLKRISNVDVGLLAGLFCISYIFDESYFEVCVMKKYGVKESWTKEFTIDTTLNVKSMSDPNHRFNFFKIKDIPRLTLLNNGNMVVGCSRRLLYYIPRKRAIHDILHLTRNDTKWVTGIYHAIDLVPSFISLKIIGGGIVGVVQRRNHGLVRE